MDRELRRLEKEAEHGGPEARAKLVAYKHRYSQDSQPACLPLHDEYGNVVKKPTSLHQFRPACSTEISDLKERWPLAVRFYVCNLCHGVQQVLAKSSDSFTRNLSHIPNPHPEPLFNNALRNMRRSDEPPRA